MKDYYDKVDPDFVKVCASSPIRVGAPSIENNSQDMKILFGNGLEIRPKSQNKSLNLLKKRQIYERESTEVEDKIDPKLSENPNAAKCRKYRDNEMTKKLRIDKEEIKL